MNVRFLATAVLALVMSALAPVLATPSATAMCGRPSPTHATCFAAVWAKLGGSDAPVAEPQGYGPAQFRSAYHITATGADDRIAIVDAYGGPNVASDLATYSKQFGLRTARLRFGHHPQLF